jgi:methionyl-tRNA formyltransferase
MRIVFWGKGARGRVCLEAVLGKGFEVALVVVQPSGAEAPSDVAELATRHGIEVIAPDDPNDPDIVALFKACQADLFVLAGYGRILRPATLTVPFMGTVNLHAGRLPERRGSSPLNWALIDGSDSFGLSIIEVNAGVDTGDVLSARDFPIGPEDTIQDLHEIADNAFPSVLLEVLNAKQNGTLQPRAQDNTTAAYYPVRFPTDGLILWDIFTAEEIHRRVRALTLPYPCAFTTFRGRKVKLIRTRLNPGNHFGEAGRIYRISKDGLLACARDRCLWVVGAVFADDDTPLDAAVQRYDRLGTVREAALNVLMDKGSK